MTNEDRRPTHEGIRYERGAFADHVSGAKPEQQVYRASSGRNTSEEQAFGVAETSASSRFTRLCLQVSKTIGLCRWLFLAWLPKVLRSTQEPCEILGRKGSV